MDAAVTRGVDAAVTVRLVNAAVRRRVERAWCGLLLRMRSLRASLWGVLVGSGKRQRQRCRGRGGGRGGNNFSKYGSDDGHF